MARSKAYQRELDIARLNNDVEFYFGAMYMRLYLADDIANEGGFERLELSGDCVLNYVYNVKPDSVPLPTNEGLSSSAVEMLHKYRKATADIKQLRNPAK